MINDRLRHYRMEQNLDQRKIARSVGITRTRLQMYEAGLEIPTMRELEKFAKVFKVSVDDILREEVIRVQTIQFVNFREQCKKICFGINIAGYVLFLIGFVIMILVTIMSYYVISYGNVMTRTDVQLGLTYDDIISLRNKYFNVALIFMAMAPIFLLISFSTPHVRMFFRKLQLKKGRKKK